jgi:predicted DNA-binding transcriptional regulator AlpA
MTETHTHRRRHVDRRAEQLLDQVAEASDDELLSTKQMADWFGVSQQWLTHRRHFGGGPPFERLSDKVVRYRRSTVRKWLDQRIYLRTRDYMTYDGEVEDGQR